MDAEKVLLYKPYYLCYNLNQIKSNRKARNMEKVWELFDNLNEYVYVTDMDSCKLVYMNKKALKKFGFGSVDDAAGKKCYEVIHHCSEPCAICNNNELEPGKFKEWWNYDPYLKKHFVLKDTMIIDEGRRLRMELAFDTSSFDWQHNSYQNLEAIVNEGLRVALAEPTPDRSLNVLLEYMGKALNGERTYIFEKNERGGDDNTYEWTAAGITPEINNLKNLPPEICANWYRNFSENKNIVIEDLEDIKDSDPLQYANLKRQDIHSLVVVPLYENGSTIGFYGVDNPPAESIEYAANMLQIMGHFIVSSLKRRNLVRELQVMSFTDQLTNLGNRHAMQAYIKKGFNGCDSMGAVYCDITGLKRVNDTEGHEAGDRLIVQASRCLEKAFEGFGLFRIGGDELLSLCPGIVKREFEEKLGSLKKYMKESSLVMAMGAVLRDGGSFDLDGILSEAEALMYEDKAAYYRSEGVDRRTR